MEYTTGKNFRLLGQMTQKHYNSYADFQYSDFQYSSSFVQDFNIQP